ncbi:MAG: hypothetical protein J1F03_08620 [Oscillospiraceae bacterium]|nr:hypothetical protein [Oscillospiraceae bacterium]
MQKIFIIGVIVFLIFAVFILVLVFMDRSTSKLEKAAKEKMTHYSPKKYVYARTKNNYDETTLEYCRIHNKTIEELSYEDRNKIDDYTENWILYFIAWLVKRHFFVFTDEEMSQKYETEIISEACTPSRLFDDVDNCLSSDNIPPELYDFMHLYFELDLAHDSYLSDYLSVIHRLGSYDYCIEFSWDIYHEIEKLIDAAYKEHTIAFEFDDDGGEELGVFHCDWLNADITARKSKDVPEEYAKRCIEHFLSLSAEMQQKICEEIKETMFWDEEDDISDIISCSHFDSISIFKPYGDEPAYTIGGEPDYEPEHGIGVIIRGDKVLAVGYRGEAEYSSPWLKEYVEEYNKQTEQFGNQ